MADDGVFTKNADIAARAGVNANATAVAVAATDVYVLNIESFINSETEYNWSDKYATLNADVKGILTDVGACLCAIYVINYDIDAIGRTASSLMVNILYTRAMDGLRILKEKAKQNFIINA